MKTFYLFGVLLFWMLNAKSQTNNNIDAEASNAAIQIITAWQKNDTKALGQFMMDYNTHESLAKSITYSSEAEKDKYLKHLDSYYNKLNTKVQKSYTESTQRCKDNSVDIKKINASVVKVELKKNAPIPMTTVTIKSKDNNNTHVLFIEGLIKYNGKWYVTEGLRFWK